MERCQPPRPTTKRPELAVPPKACDCHAHVLGPEARFPYVADRSFTPPDASSADFLSMLGSLGIERMVVVQPSVYGVDNRRTLAAIAELGAHRACGIAMVSGDVDVATLRALNANGIRGARFITTAKGGPTLDQLPDVAKRIAPFGWHIEMYVPSQVWPEVLPVVAELPVPVVFDHMGGLRADTDPSDPALQGILALLESGRAWVKLCGYRASVAGHPYADVAPLAKIFIERALERCVWGSDWPHTAIPGYMPDDGDLLDLLAVWAPDPAARQKILADNPAALYRFEA